MRFIITVCLVLIGTPLFSQGNNNLTELKKYKWWLKYETKKVSLDSLKKSNEMDLVNNDELLCYFKAKAPVNEEKSFCLIDDSNNNTFIINTSYDKTQKDKIERERHLCINTKVALLPDTKAVKRSELCEVPAENITLEKFENDYYVYKDPAQLTYLKDSGADTSKMKCLFKEQYFLGEWKYKLEIAPDINKEQKLLTIVSNTGNCISGTVKYYVGELVKEDKNQGQEQPKKKKRFFFF